VSAPTARSGPPGRQAASPGPWRLLFRRLRHNRVATTGGAILGLLYLSSCLAGFLSPYHFDDRDRESPRAGPMLLGNFVHVPEVLESRVEPGAEVHVWGRQWRWFQGGVHFHDSAGRFTLRPHVHPLVEKTYEDEWGDTGYALAAADTSVSLPVEFFVRGDPRTEVVSLMGLFPVRGGLHLFGVRAPPGLQGSARVYLLGSDKEGRDALSRLLYGSQISLSVGILGILVSMSLGMLVGGLSGYFRGAFDAVTMRLVEVVLAVPALYLIIVAGGFLRQVQPGGRPLTSTQVYMMIVLVLAFVYWASISRVIRGMVLSLREADYVVAARAAGIPDWRIVTRHVLPNTLSYAIVTATLAVPYYILGEVSLSFLGLGIQDPEASWGNMLYDAQQPTYLREHPWVVVPGVLIFVTVLAYNFLGDGLRDAADPRAVVVRR
jgi:peptide/nickel transport system permease protein